MIRDYNVINNIFKQKLLFELEASDGSVFSDAQINKKTKKH